MLKLKKTKATSWNGNGFGNSSADWCIKGQEHIHVFQLSMGWVAKDTSINGLGFICKADSRSDLITVLEVKLAS
jgi:hypothetical protein